MTNLIAALPMYDWPEMRAETDALWVHIRTALLSAGIDAPETLTRDQPDLQTLWRAPNLIFAQACWGPLGQGLADHVQVIGQPDYSDVEGGDGALYRSVVLMRHMDGASQSVAPPSVLPDISPATGETTHGNPGDWPISPPVREMSGRTEGGNVECHAAGDRSFAALLGDLRKARFAYNSTDSMSGYLALEQDLGSLDIFSEHVETGGHRASIIAVAQERADICAIDCRSWALAKRHERAAATLVPIGWTTPRKGLPYITSLHTPPQELTRMRQALGYAGILVGA